MQLQCSCGNFQAKLKAFPKNTEIIPAYPADIDIVKGIEQLKSVRLSSKGMYPADVDKILDPVRSSIMGK